MDTTADYWTESARRSEALREEMELHLEEKAAELEAGGMTADRARTEARRRFGNVGLKHGESREIWVAKDLIVGTWPGCPLWHSHDDRQQGI